MSSYIEASGSQSIITRTATVQVPAGSRVARIPVGNFFFGKQDPLQTECVVTLGGVAQTYGPDFAWYYSGCTNPGLPGQPASVRDVASGVLFNDPVAQDSVCVLTWKQRILGVPCDQVMLVRTDWDEALGKFRLWQLPDPNAPAPNGNTTVLNTHTDWYPNSVMTPEPRPGLVIEVWRLARARAGRTWKNIGGGNYGAYDRHGARYLPYFRGPHPDCAETNIIPVHRILQGGNFPPNWYGPLPNGPGPFHGAGGWRYWGGPFVKVIPDPSFQPGASGSAGERRLALKLCWYDTLTGARGPLSPFNLIYAGTMGAPDRHSPNVTLRNRGCLWIETQ